jgi:tyrosine-protein kinase Etk/Wzc
MMQSTSIPSSVSMATEDDELSLSDILAVFRPHAKTLLAIWLGASVMGYGASFLLPVIYTAKAKVLPPQSSGGGLSAMLSQLPAGLAGAAGGLGKDQGQLYIGLLGTTTLANRMVERFDLKHHYRKESMGDTRDALLKQSVFTSGKDTLISIEVDDEDPKLAAKIANTYPEELNHLLQSAAISDASLRRKFFEEQLRKTKQDLSDAEINFKQLQEKTGIMRLEDQGRAVISAAATLRAQMTAKQVELQAIKISATEESSEARRLRAELDALQTQLMRVEQGSDETKTEAADPFNLNVNKIPSKGMEYMRRYRDLKFQETMYELMVKQYEIAKMEEARTSQTVQLIDPALVPERKSKPKRSVVAALSGLSILLLSSIYIFFRSSKKNS